eukprot:Rmarinus@m.29779
MAEKHVVRARATTRVRNKMPAPVQITAEQLLKDAQAYREEEVRFPKQKILDQGELMEYRMQRRKEFEDAIRKNRMVIYNYTKYAAWEESQHEFRRARSVYERALAVDSRQTSLWLKYAEMEMRHRFVNSARNVWDRAVTLLPRVDQFWYKFAYMEEMLGNIPGARSIFERWMEWSPGEPAWSSYVKFEMRYGEVDRARDIMERFVLVHPAVKPWLKYAKFEERGPDKLRAREVYERAFSDLAEDGLDERLFMAFAKFEESVKEFERARKIYQYGLDNIPKAKCEGLFNAYTQFEKQYGSTEGIEEVILSKRRFQYEEELKASALNYDVWFDYIRLEESGGDHEKTREVYERAIANIPPAEEKKYWRRYIYLWLNYAIFEELDAEDVGRARQVYALLLKTLPHHKFTFAKAWLMAANLEIRQKDVKAARMLLGQALGRCPKEKIFKEYIQLELQLGEIDRCRTLYEKFVEFAPSSCQTWARYAELEQQLGETERARAIFEVAVGQPVLDIPELLWKAYIDFEISEEQFENVRDLYERLLEKTKHVKVWISYAMFECTEAMDTAKARKVFERGFDETKWADNKEERVMLLEAWNRFEEDVGTEETRQRVKAAMPRRQKKQKAVFAADGSVSGWEEYIEYVFPDEEGAKASSKLLALAAKLKQAGDDSSDESGSESDNESEAGSDKGSDKGSDEGSEKASETEAKDAI